MCHVSLLSFSQLQWKKNYHFFNLWLHDIKVLIEMFWSRLHAFSSIKKLQDSACMKNRNKNAMLNGLFVYLNFFFFNFVAIEFSNNRETSARINSELRYWVHTFTHRRWFAVVNQSVVLIGLPEGGWQTWPTLSLRPALQCSLHLSTEKKWYICVKIHR